MVDKLKDLLRILPGLWAWRWHGLAAAVITTIVGGLAVTMLPDKYEASSRLFVDTQSILKPLMTGMTVTPNVEQQLAMMARTLISRPNVERAAKAAGLDAGLGDAKREKLIESLLKEIEFKTAGKENLYLLSYRGSDPGMSLRLVKELLEIFAETKDESKRRDNEQARTFIDGQIAIYEKKLLDAENALKEFKLRNLSVMPQLAQDYIARSNDAQKEVGAARLELRQAENAREALQRRLIEEPELVPAVDASGAGAGRPVVSEIDQRIDGARRRLDDLLTRFTDEHPDVIAMRRQVEALMSEKAAIERARPAGGPAPGTVMVPNKVHQDIKLSLTQTEAQVAALRAKVADGERRLGEARDGARTIPKVEAEFAQLNRDYDVNKKNYEQLLSRRESAQISGSLETSPGVGEFRTVDPPRVSPRPTWPNRPLLFGAVLALACMVGVVWAWIRDAMRPVYRDGRTLRRETGLPLLTVIALVESRAQKQARREATMKFALACAGYVVVFGGLLGWLGLRQFMG